MRLLLIVTVITTLFYLMTGLVYSEGGFEGALVVKPYPMRVVMFGGGEEGAWARYHPGQTPPWFMQKDLMVISRFSWEEGGDPAWVTAYVLVYLATLLAWVALAVIGAVRLIRVLARRAKSNESLKADA
jgi:hypothetical protein